MDRTGLEQILEQYRKHGWTLQQVLLSDHLRENIGDTASLFGQSEIISSELDAAWFSRLSKPGTTAWELRHLSEAPYALVTGIDDAFGPDEAESALRSTEAKMLEVTRFRKFKG